MMTMVVCMNCRFVLICVFGVCVNVCGVVCVVECCLFLGSGCSLLCCYIV